VRSELYTRGQAWVGTRHSSRAAGVHCTTATVDGYTWERGRVGLAPAPRSHPCGGLEPGTGLQDRGRPAWI